MKQNGKRQIFFGLLALLTVLCLWVAALAADNGTWGNLKWTYENGVMPIEDNAFMNCNKLTTVYYAGTEEDRAKMTIENGNDLLLDAKWIYSSKKAEKDLSVSSGTSPEQP